MILLGFQVTPSSCYALGYSLLMCLDRWAKDSDSGLNGTDTAASELTDTVDRELMGPEMRGATKM